MNKDELTSVFRRAFGRMPGDRSRPEENNLIPPKEEKVFPIPQAF